MKIKLHKFKQGVSIVELMVAIAIGLLITAAIASLYVSNKQSFNLQDEMSRLQESIRIMTESISTDARYAGYLGCSSLPGAKGLLQSAIYMTPTTPKKKLYQFAQGVDGLNDVGAWSSADQYWKNIIPAGNAEPKPNTDILALYGGGGGTASVVQSNNPSGILVTPDPDAVFVAKTSEEAQGCASGLNAYNGFLCRADVVVVSNCRAAVIFQVTGIAPDTTNTGRLRLLHAATLGGHPGNANHLPDWDSLMVDPGPWHVDQPDQRFLAEEGAEVTKLTTRIYYVGKDNAFYVLDPSVSSSFSALGTPIKLAENVEDFQVEYGVPTTKANMANCYVTADKISNRGASAAFSTCAAAFWEDVISLRVTFVARSAKTNLFPAKASTFSVAGQTITDGALRRRVTQEITLRNRVQ